jgi:DNA-directed RNA polymerase
MRAVSSCFSLQMRWVMLESKTSALLYMTLNLTQLMLLKKILNVILGESLPLIRLKKVLKIFTTEEMRMEVTTENLRLNLY